jgi:hypothetical protein
MSNTYTWKITNLQAFANLNGESNVVSNVDWVCSGTDGVNTEQINGSQAITYNSNNNFIPFNQLTESEIIGWIQNALGLSVQDVQSQIDTKINNIVNPSVVTKLPWATT